MRIKFSSDTLLKALPVAINVLQGKDAPEQLLRVAAGEILDIVDHQPWTEGPMAQIEEHVFFQLEKPKAGSQGVRWFVDGKHAVIDGCEPGNDPQDEPSTAEPEDESDYGPTITLPGISRPVGIYEPVYFEPTKCNFTWSEMTKGGQRIPVSATVTQRIVKLCKYMDEVRAYLGDRPIHVNSGYRDPVTNRRVKGARNSRHMAGDAVDFWVEGMDVVEVFNKLKTFHPRGGLAVGNGFVHLDLRPGAAARWSYPGGPVVDLW